MFFVSLCDIEFLGVGGGGNALDLSYKECIYVNYEEVNK